MPYRWNLTLPSQTGLPADSVVWTFHTFATGDIGEIATAIGDFATEVTPYVSPSIVRVPLADLTAYDTADPEPRQPIWTQPVTLSNPTINSPFPNEVACCLSYRAIYTSGDPNARRRGRVYIGPLNLSAGVETGGVSRPGPTFRQDLADAATTLQAAILAAGSQWAVYSRTDDVARAVVGGWVDNEWDTQRRRGWRSTSRILWGGDG